ncbi:MAG: hypothetical protein H6741_27430 [Alphaproteobacteria bacterium]|nr:hypothetical protein [Alphaproteobacteria bacterium]
MVLISRRGWLGGSLSALLLAGCLPKQGGLVVAPQATETSICAVLQRLDSGGLEPVPAALAERLDAQLTARNLTPKDTSAAAVPTFSTRQTTPQRLAWMAQQDGAGELLVLVATQVEFYSQMSGRWRWTVSVELTVAPKADLGQAVSSSFTVPVFMQFHHEREPEALVEASPVIERELGYLLDQVLSGMQG